MSFTLPIPSISGETPVVDFPQGATTYFVGANGSGKTRLAAMIEKTFGARSHRISAHRALSLKSEVPKISEDRALRGLRFGSQDAQDSNAMIFRDGNRWSGKSEVSLLNDFDHLLQALFADQANIAMKTHKAAHAGTLGIPELTKFQRLTRIWEKVLPHRKLDTTGDDIRVVAEHQDGYQANDLSDGERAAFYLIGQVLVAQQDSILIFDEPELHMHRAILGRLWDEVEAERPDCALIVITHDLEFVASRLGPKYVVKAYMAPGRWHIEQVPLDTGFGEEITTLILGSRCPILFIEGSKDSLDATIYRACYNDWTVLPVGSSEQVIHSVVTMRKNAGLTRITCAGIVDADDRSADEKVLLQGMGIAALPVAEIENLILLPSITEAILREEKYDQPEISERQEALTSALIAEIEKGDNIDRAVLRYCCRRIDRALKLSDLSILTGVDQLSAALEESVGSINVQELAKGFRDQVDASISTRNVGAILQVFDGKSVVALAAKHLKSTSKREFESWLLRALKSPKSNSIREAFLAVLPALKPS